MSIRDFHGASGRSYGFERTGPDSDWPAREGIALFAAPALSGWSVVGMAELDGRPENLSAIWALREAERFGAKAVFFRDTKRVLERKTVLADLDKSLEPFATGEAAAA